MISSRFERGKEEMPVSTPANHQGPFLQAQLRGLMCLSVAGESVDTMQDSAAELQHRGPTEVVPSLDSRYDVISG